MRFLMGYRITTEQLSVSCFSETNCKLITKVVWVSDSINICQESVLLKAEHLINL